MQKTLPSGKYFSHPYKVYVSYSCYFKMCKTIKVHVALECFKLWETISIADLTSLFKHGMH